MQPPLVVVVVMLWMSEKRFRVSGGWPMQLLAPFLFVATNRARRWLHDDRLHVLRYPILRRPRRQGIRLQGVNQVFHVV